MLLSSSCVLNMSLPICVSHVELCSWAGCSEKLSEHGGELKVALTVKQTNLGASY